MNKKQEEFHKELMRCFYALSAAERAALEGDLTLNEIHLIEVVFDALESGTNTFSAIAKRIGVTTGTLSTAFNRLAKKGYLKREQYLVDMRVHYIKPTAKAEAAHKRHMAWHLDMLDQATTPGKYDEFIAIFKGFTTTFQDAVTKSKQ